MFCSRAAGSLRRQRRVCASTANTSGRDETPITKDRERWLVKFKDTEFFVNVDEMLEPALGHYVEIKSRTWSRNDAEHKAALAHQLLAALGLANGETVTKDYIEVVQMNQ